MGHTHTHRYRESFKREKVELNDEKNSNRSRRGDTIRELRRIIYPSRGMAQRNQRSHKNRDVPFTFVPDPNDHLASMEDSLNDLLQQLGTHPSSAAARRFNPNESGQPNHPRRTEQQPERVEPPVPDIPRRLLLDNLSDEEEQVPDDIKRE